MALGQDPLADITNATDPASEMKRKAAARLAGLGYAKGYAGAATKAVETARESGQKMAANIRSRAAQALASQAARAGRAPLGGGAVGALSDVAANVGRQESAAIAQGEDEASKRAIEAQKAGLQAAEYLGKMGSSYEDAQVKDAKLMEAANKIAAQHAGGFLAADKNEDAAAQIRQLVATEPDPVIKKKYEDLANKIAAGDVELTGAGLGEGA